MKICGINTQNPWVTKAEMGLGLVASAHGMKTFIDHKNLQNQTIRTNLNKAADAETLPIPVLTTQKKVIIAAEILGGAALFLHGLKG